MKPLLIVAAVLTLQALLFAQYVVIRTIRRGGRAAVALLVWLALYLW